MFLSDLCYNNESIPIENITFNWNDWKYHFHMIRTIHFFIFIFACNSPNLHWGRQLGKLDCWLTHKPDPGSWRLPSHIPCLGMCVQFAFPVSRSCSRDTASKERQIHLGALYKHLTSVWWARRLSLLATIKISLLLCSPAYYYYKPAT